MGFRVMKAFRFGAAIALWALAALAAAQTDEADVVIVVTAERTAQPASESIASTTVVTAKQIRDQGARTAADVLRIAPGVAMRQSGQMGAAAVAFVRGTKANQVLVLVDGQRVSSPAFIGGTDLSKFPVSEIARIEIIRGPVSSLYGSEATGGVVNIITKKTSGESGDATSSVGENGRSERWMALRGDEGLLSWQLTASAPRYSGVRPNSDYSATNLTAGIALESLGGWDVRLRGESYRDVLGLPNADPNHTGYFDPDDRQWWDRDNISLTAARDLGDGQVELRAYRMDQQLHNNAPGFDWMGLPVVYDSLITGQTDAVELSYRLSRGPHQWVLGGEYRDDDYEDIETGAAPSEQREGVSNLAFFAQDRWSIGSKADVVLGARYDNHSQAGAKITPRAGLSYAVAPDARLRLSYAEGFRAPNFVELYYPAGPWGPGYSGNPNLRPEKSRQYEIGLNARRAKDTFDAAVFHSAVTDLIQADSATPYENVGRARQRGVEISWDRRLSGSTNLALAYTYIDASNRTTGERLRGIPHNLLNITLSSVVQSWQIGLTGRWTDDRPDLAFDPLTWASTPVMLPGRSVFDLTMTSRGSDVNPFFVVRNLANVSYEEVAGYPTEGRSFEFGVHSDW